MDYSPWGCKELDTAERLTLQLFGLNAKTALFFVLIVYTHTHTHTHTQTAPLYKGRRFCSLHFKVLKK